MVHGSGGSVLAAGGQTIVKDYVRERHRRLREIFVPLAHPPGHAQADFGEADAIIAGVKLRAHFFVMTLPHSDACFVVVYPAATAEAWLDGRPGKGNEKGNVEGAVGYARRNFMTPLPCFASWDAFNAYLEEQCRKRQGEVLRGHAKNIGERLEQDLEALTALPPTPFDRYNPDLGGRRWRRHLD